MQGVQVLGTRGAVGVLRPTTAERRLGPSYSPLNELVHHQKPPVPPKPVPFTWGHALWGSGRQSGVIRAVPQGACDLQLLPKPHGPLGDFWARGGGMGDLKTKHLSL